MTIRTGKSGRCRYHACSITARQGETGCVGRATAGIGVSGFVPKWRRE
ncbi:hypothetical protein [Phreatobacter sp. AB_2022a]|nr:hypothetical protein [Phreatobacter sp. AB_2022a]MCZ0737960.1 hypothetical protein [Phreatobacter sp. AB_2022a]